jgi:NAD-dependent deacetylase
MKRCGSAARTIEVDLPPCDDLDAAREHVRAALRPGGLAVLTGAGMSAESGIPTFRDAMTGLWSRFDPAELASEEGFRAQPQRVWQWYAERRDGVRHAQPNAGHSALAAFDRRHPGVLTIITQNVDDLHQRAGNRDAIRLHGDILEDCWLGPCSHQPLCAVAAARGSPPRCAECGNHVRPGVVWFGEMLPALALERAERAARHCSVMLVVGTSGAVWPAAGLAGAARRFGAWVAIVNPNASEIDEHAHLVLRGNAAHVLPALLEGV